MKVKVAQLCPTLCNPMDCIVLDSPGQSTGVGSLSLLQGIYPTQGPNSGLRHCRRILYQLSQSEADSNPIWCLYKWGKLGPTCTQGKVHVQLKQRQRWCFDMTRNTKNCQKTTRSWRRSRGQILLYNSQKKTTLPTRWSWISSLRNERRERTMFLPLCGTLFYQP